MIIALAGHVDHGKTSLIRALTGIDPDRLPDEKQRGMTIDLGFAHLPLPDGSTLGFVDVPGHERFLGNMLAGVLSIDTALLVIAADDGPMPQTREHLAILRLTGVADLAVAITKTDRVDAERVAEVGDGIRDLLARAGFEDVPMLPVSSQTGEGIEALRAFLLRKAASWRPRAVSGGFRLAVDRAFVVAGSGVVVTGTVLSGQVGIGDRLVLAPAHLAVRVRGIQRHHAAAEVAAAGDRCALAISGPRVERDRIHRGDWLIAPHLFRPTGRIDARVRVTEGQVLKQGGAVHVHVGSAAVPGRAVMAVVGDLAEGREGFATLTLGRPIAAVFGDRVVLRDAGSQRVVAGGIVVDPFTPTRRTRRELRLRVLEALSHPDVTAMLGGLLAEEGWVDVAPLAIARNTTAQALIVAASALPARLVGGETAPVLLSDTALAEVRTALLGRLARWHQANPDLPGPGKAALLAALAAYPADVTEAALGTLLADGSAVRRGRVLSLPDHQPTLSPEDRQVWERVEPAMEAAGLRAPRVRELAAELAMDPEAMERRLVRLERFGLVMRVASNRFFLPATVVALGEVAEALAREDESGGFLAGAYSQRSGIGRNLTIQVLEYLDRIGVTQRVGDHRIMRRPAALVVE